MQKEIKNNLKKVAFKNFSSYDELSEISGISKNTISNLLNVDDSNPTVRTLEKLSFACGQDLIKLFYINGSFRNSIVRKISRCILVENYELANQHLKEFYFILNSVSPENEDASLYYYYKKYEKLFNFYFSQIHIENFNFQNFGNDFKNTFRLELLSNKIKTYDYFVRDIYYFSGLILYRKSSLEEAKGIFTRLLDFDVCDDTFLACKISLAKIHLKLKEYQVCIDICNEALRICVSYNFCFDILEVLKIRDEAQEKILRKKLLKEFNDFRLDILK